LIFEKINIRDFVLKDDFDLLDRMLFDARSQPPLYHPGPYWATKAKNAQSEIKRCGIADFRGSTNNIGMSFTDNLFLDIRNAYNHGLRRIFRWLTMTYPLSNIFESQMRWTKIYATRSIELSQELLSTSSRVNVLLKKYEIPYSLLGGCLMKVEIDGVDYSSHYLSLLEQHDNIATKIDFAGATSVFEIGGGFGANIHLLLTNYKNIRKVLYLDIPPNLYVGTQYLKAIYGQAVSDYTDLRDRESIEFSANDDFEIYCIAPWQLQKYDGSLDILMNAHSFVEMPENVVKNYIDEFDRISDSKDPAIAMTSYDKFDPHATLHPSRLPQFFEDREFDCFEAASLLQPSRKNFYFVSPGNLVLT
jgi:putative sugar O-methyltransferase